MCAIVFLTLLNINKACLCRSDATLRNPSETVPKIYMKREWKDMPVPLYVSCLKTHTQPLSVIPLNITKRDK